MPKGRGDRIADSHLRAPERVGRRCASRGACLRVPSAGARLAPLLLGVLFWGGCAVSRELPSDVLGYWTTDDARFAGRFLHLERGSVEFGRGDADGPETFLIHAVRSRPSGRDLVITVSYLAEDDPFELSFVYDPRAETLRLENRSDVLWRRRSGQGAVR